ncbi:metallo-beta-lactamase superfamily protein [Trichophyton benhamiae CBS 112371]|uniref:Metallo-beta-lactamase superfamily protein n=1 Tax=Arthroderma benhamiae (strain ATCC MYA-4681 / CBS 112371) TaxID=663331 RepID=D4ANI4_ARTBC|nr:metallo-beta-lactamase superfamily protein [Trichophyton benhamiae CBS 112371]EFE35745.1 metallo-beta-lactamase superfamily protein [Trichophyton benhamiae CBS 112371]
MPLLLDSLEVTVIIDNELDVMSPPPPTTVGSIISHGSLGNISRESAHVYRGNAEVRELKMESICCAAHGLSILLTDSGQTGTIGNEKRSILFDAGPEEDAWERNAKRLGVDLSSVETIVLSHWHRDHSGSPFIYYLYTINQYITMTNFIGGMLRAIRMIKKAQEAQGTSNAGVVVDVHPSRPKYRGFQLGEEIISLQADPGFDEMTAAGATVSKNSQPHNLADGMFHVSGMIPRETEYETGLKGAMRLDDGGNWEKDEEIADERAVTCRVRARHVKRSQQQEGKEDEAREDQEEDIFAIIGGYHLATSDEAAVHATVHDLKALNPHFLVPGHCSGWRVKMAIENAMPGRLLPCSVGAKLTFADQALSAGDPSVPCSSSTKY